MIKYLKELFTRRKTKKFVINQRDILVSELHHFSKFNEGLKLEGFLEAYKNRDYLWSRQYKKKFLIHHKGTLMREMENGNSFGHTIRKLENYENWQLRNSLDMEIMNHYSSVMWVSTDKFNVDINIDGNLGLNHKTLQMDEWILYSDYKAEQREKRLSKLLDK